MRSTVLRLVVPAALAVTVAGCSSSAVSERLFDTYRGRDCARPIGHDPADCRLAARGAPDLSGQAFQELGFGDVTVHARVRRGALAPNPDEGGRRSWPLIDSLAQPMGRLEATPTGGMRLRDLRGLAYPVSQATVRGYGCAADPEQQRTHTLIQVVALKARASGTQGFLDARALDRSTRSGRVAWETFTEQVGEGTGCGPARRERGRGPIVGLRDPKVHPVTHARLGGGGWNTVIEYDAKPDFGNVVYFSSNTTNVHQGGMTRGMVRIGTPVRRIDRFDYCDPNSDGTLTWDYVAIHAPGARRMYGWIPAVCPRSLREAD